MKVNKSIVFWLALSFFISIGYSTVINKRHQKVYTVNLGKILSAQVLMAGRMAQMGDKKSLWMATIKDTSGRVRQVIHSIAGNNLVIVTPAVIQGSIDITSEVLRKLNLPTKIPELSVRQNNVIPNVLPKIIKRKILKKSEGGSWKLP